MAKDEIERAAGHIVAQLRLGHEQIAEQLYETIVEYGASNVELDKEIEKVLSR